MLLLLILLDVIFVFVFFLSSPLSLCNRTSLLKHIGYLRFFSLVFFHRTAR